MVSCIKIETASLIFAILSLLATFLGSLAYIVFMVRLFLRMSHLITDVQEKLSEEEIEKELWTTYYALYMNTVLAVIPSIMIIGFVFSTILTTGLISKKSNLVKAYYVYGVTGTVLGILFALYVLTLSVKTGLLILLGCSVYVCILMMIKKTYLNIAKNEQDQRCQKDVVAEKTISIKL